MDDAITRALAAGDGLVSYARLLALGYSLNAVTSMVRSGTLARMWHGQYAAGRHVASLGVGPRHALTARAVALRVPGHALSHQTALLLWQLPVLESDLDVVHVCGVDRGRPRRAPKLRVHPAVTAESVTERAGLSLVRPEIAVAQTAALIGPRAGLMAADAGLRKGLFTSELLHRAVSQLKRPGRAQRVVQLATGACESPGESWCRLVFADLGMEQPRAQVEIRDGQGRFVARVDFLFEASRVVVEFDGLVKYAAVDGRDQLVAEKRREDALRRLGYRVVRLTWADLFDQERVAQLLLSATASVRADV